MPRVCFTTNLIRHVACPEEQVGGRTVREALTQVFDRNPRVKGYVLDDRGELRKHMLIAIDGVMMHHRDCLDDPVKADSEIYVLQALSGG